MHDGMSNYYILVVKVSKYFMELEWMLKINSNQLNSNVFRKDIYVFSFEEKS